MRRGWVVCGNNLHPCNPCIPPVLNTRIVVLLLVAVPPNSVWYNKVHLLPWLQVPLLLGITNTISTWGKFATRKVETYPPPSEMDLV